MGISRLNRVVQLLEHLPMGTHLSRQIIFFAGFKAQKNSENSLPGVEQLFINIAVGLIAVPAWSFSWSLLPASQLRFHLVNPTEHQSPFAAVTFPQSKERGEIFRLLRGPCISAYCSNIRQMWEKEANCFPSLMQRWEISVSLLSSGKI